MLRNYLKIAFRNLFKNKVYSFINITGLATKRAKEVGVRKAVGSGREQLIKQFLSESLLTAFFAFLLALLMVAIALPFFNKLTEKEMSLQLTNPLFWMILIAFTIITGVLSGSYPALYLSSFNPVKILKGNPTVGKGGSLPRKILVVVQFACSVVLMIGAIVIYQQIQHGKNRPIGFNKEGLISVIWTNDIDKNFGALQRDLMGTGAITSVCKTNSPPTQIYSNNSGWDWKNSQPNDKAAIFSTIVTE